jgi:hypothetical protein
VNDAPPDRACANMAMICGLATATAAVATAVTLGRQTGFSWRSQRRPPIRGVWAAKGEGCHQDCRCDGRLLIREHARAKHHAHDHGLPSTRIAPQPSPDRVFVEALLCG